MISLDERLTCEGKGTDQPVERARRERDKVRAEECEPRLSKGER